MKPQVGLLLSRSKLRRHQVRVGLQEVFSPEEILFRNQEIEIAGLTQAHISVNHFAENRTLESKHSHIFGVEEFHNAQKFAEQIDVALAAIEAVSS
jgi:hypothetical protein